MKLSRENQTGRQRPILEQPNLTATKLEEAYRRQRIAPYNDDEKLSFFGKKMKVHFHGHREKTGKMTRIEKQK